MDLYEGFQSQNSNKQLFCKRVSLQKVSDGALTKGHIMKFTRFTLWAGGYSGQRPLVLACQCWTADQRTALCRLPAARWSLPHRETICRSLTEDWEAKHSLSQTKGNFAVYAEKKKKKKSLTRFRVPSGAAKWHWMYELKTWTAGWTKQPRGKCSSSWTSVNHDSRSLS